MYSSVNTIWVLFGTALVFFMQAGFSLCEAGFTRAKNTGNILMKNLMDFCIGTPAFWLVGFGLMFGKGSGIIGSFDPLIRGEYSQALPSGVPLSLRSRSDPRQEHTYAPVLPAFLTSPSCDRRIQVWRPAHAFPA